VIVDNIDTMAPIIGVAIKFNNRCWVLPKPNRHHHVIRKIAQTNGKGIDGPDIQGFYDSNGKFLNRKDALKVALHFGQVLDVSKLRGDNLYSEDLW
jgi:hypothetical protein